MQELRKNYRIPTIDEFVDGFTYEVYSEGYFEDSVEDFCGWYTYTVGKNNWRDIEDIERELRLGNIQALAENVLNSKQIDEKKIREFIDHWERIIYPYEETNDQKRAIKTLITELDTLLRIYSHYLLYTRLTND